MGDCGVLAIINVTVDGWQLFPAASFILLISLAPACSGSLPHLLGRSDQNRTILLACKGKLHLFFFLKMGQINLTTSTVRSVLYPGSGEPSERFLCALFLKRWAKLCTS